MRKAQSYALSAHRLEDIASTRLPFGLKSAPEVFQNCMSDLLTWGKDDDEHD